MSRARESLSGKVVAITGGGRGIGRATAEALVQRGARVAIGDIDAALAERTAGEIGSGVAGLPVDVTDAESFSLFVKAAEERLGPLDVLVNNAGVMLLGTFHDEAAGTTQRMVDINVTGVLTGSKLAMQRFRARGHGHLINIASAAGRFGLPNGATYCATKFAVVGLSDALRRESRGTDIKVSVVMPAPVNTALGQGLAPSRAYGEVEPEDVAEAIVAALERPRFEVYVPKQLQPMHKSLNLATTRVGDWFFRAFKGDQVLAQSDSSARAEYEAKAGKVTPQTTDEQSPAEINR